MRRSQRIGLFVMALVLVGLVGCATYPISRQYRMMASKNVNFTMVLKNPDAYKGAIVIWGGRIVETTNTPQGSEITVLQTPLSGWEEPTSPEYSPGRFIAETSQFLDPAIYKPGKRITLAGEVMGGEKKPLGTTEYTYPIVEIRQLHLWPVPKLYAYEPYDYWPWWMSTGWAYNPGYWSYPGYGYYYGYEGRERHHGGRRGEFHGGGREGGREHEGRGR
jgi:outer membrane lipoprotein